jgi:branched-chain amino acid transport system permease protein
MVALRTFVGSYTDYWTLILGVVLILLIFFLPDGIMGINFRTWLRSRERRRAMNTVR